MYLIDTNIISEIRKKDRADPGVRQFFAQVNADNTPIYLSVVTVGELRRGIEQLRQRGDRMQAQQLETWLQRVLTEYSDCILAFEEEAAQVWGRLRALHPEHALDKQIAATALIHGLTVVTRNQNDFVATGVRVLNPFEQ
ncbi:MAG: type II toxin-antitoxin system VapC family toxin [Candidatus Competibacteraceae bacterium]|nr:type II toxin-antitoxin system VapC family toxin [Candidatus Competibacteraceae bacterium]